jgi:hypothetical protein
MFAKVIQADPANTDVARQVRVIPRIDNQHNLAVARHRGRVQCNDASLDERVR